MLTNEDHLRLRDFILDAAPKIAADVLLYDEFPYAWSQAADTEVRAILRRHQQPAQVLHASADRQMKFNRIQSYHTQVVAMDPKQRRFDSPDTIPVDERFWLIGRCASPRNDKGRPAVSVIIPTYNGSRRIGLQLDALVAQDDAPPFEVIVVDNGSTDDVAAVAARWQGRLDITVLSAPAIKGASYARNVGVSAARASKLAFCDDDDVVCAEWVRAADDALNEAAFVTGVGIEFPSAYFTSVDAVRRELTKAASQTETTPVRVSPTPTHGDHPILLGGNCAIRREMFLSLGGFDCRFDPGAEDNDLAMRYTETSGILYTANELRLAVRLPDGQRRLSRTFKHGRMYMLLAHEHGLNDTSCALNNPSFLHDLPRAAAALVVATATRQPQRKDAATRLALRTGQVVGWLNINALRRVPRPAKGFGLSR